MNKSFGCRFTWGGTGHMMLIFGRTSEVKFIEIF